MSSNSQSEITQQNRLQNQTGIYKMLTNHLQGLKWYTVCVELHAKTVEVCFVLGMEPDIVIHTEQGALGFIASLGYIARDLWLKRKPWVERSYNIHGCFIVHLLANALSRIISCSFHFDLSCTFPTCSKMCSPLLSPPQPSLLSSPILYSLCDSCVEDTLGRAVPSPVWQLFQEARVPGFQL